MGTERTSEKLRRFIHPLVMKALSATRSFRLEVSGTIPEGQPFLFVALNVRAVLRHCVPNKGLVSPAGSVETSKRETL